MHNTYKPAFSFQPEKLNVYKNDSDTSWDYTLATAGKKGFYLYTFPLFFKKMRFVIAKIPKTIYLLFSTNFQSQIMHFKFNYFIFTSFEYQL